ncbi:period circadian protein [Drosophila gunungcola]|uniref:period circadian protein n=1 Tax=Drosophila gunungcola TaxID=103775 RepID=UPI0022E89F87|nr:period circadian protein [Drosophila gunungcola]
MSNTMAAAHEPTIHYLDSVLNEEEKRCEYGHQWRNFSISRSGRFRSKNKKRDAVDGKLFDAGSGSGSGSGLGTGTGTGTGSPRDSEKVSSRTASKSAAPSTTGSTSNPGTQARSQRDQVESYKSFYETNL